MLEACLNSAIYSCTCKLVDSLFVAKRKDLLIILQKWSCKQLRTSPRKIVPLPLGDSRFLPSSESCNRQRCTLSLHFWAIHILFYTTNSCLHMSVKNEICIKDHAMQLSMKNCKKNVISETIKNQNCLLCHRHSGGKTVIIYIYSQNAFPTNKGWLKVLTYMKSHEHKLISRHQMHLIHSPSFKS